MLLGIFALFTSSFGFDYFTDADALKSKGTPNSGERSDKVCGDQLCSVVESSTYKQNKVTVIPPTEQISDEALSLLFLQTAHSGTFTEIDGKKILTLNDVSSSTVWFADRPQRVTGHESTDEFIAKWSQGEDSFTDDPPPKRCTRNFIGY